MKKLKVCMIGCGRISVVYAKAFRELSNLIEVVYAIDIDLEKAKDFAAQFNGCLAACDYKQCTSENVDIAHIATPHYLHHEMAVWLMKQKIHVLTEKPMAITLLDADNMISIAEEMDVKFGVIFQTRYARGCTHIKEIIQSGQLGKIKYAKSYLSWFRDKSYYVETDWKGTWEKEGGGVLIDQAIHSIDRVQWLVGSDIEWIEGNINNRNHEYLKVEDTAEALIKFKNGCLYHLYATNCYGYDAPVELEIVGEHGRVGMKQDLAWIDMEKSTYYEIAEEEDGVIVGKTYWGNTHVIQIKDFYNSVMNQSAVTIDGQEGKKALDIVLSIYQSSMKKERIYKEKDGSKN